MKPDAVLGSKVTMITKEEAQKLGYIIPDNYKETSVPKLNFDELTKYYRLLMITVLDSVVIPFCGTARHRRGSLELIMTPTKMP